MLIGASVQALSFPTLGYFVGRIQMALVSHYYNPEWKEELDTLLFYLLGLCFSLGCIGGIEKFLFGSTGENLTYNVRRELMRGIMFKQV